MTGGRSTDEFVHVLACGACPRVSSFGAKGWTARRTVTAADRDDEPGLAFFCPECARREGGDGGAVQAPPG